jgi:glyoxylase I family protein
VRFDHVKLVAHDVSLLAEFYEKAIGCEPLTAVMELSDDALTRGLGAPGAVVRIVWMGMPGHDDGGPTLELYRVVDDADSPGWGYRHGQGQLSFQVDDVESAVEKVIAAGGSFLGEMVDWETPSGNTARFVYLRDPEGNIVDLWARSSGQSQVAGS